MYKKGFLNRLVVVLLAIVIIAIIVGYFVFQKQELIVKIEESPILSEDKKEIVMNGGTLLTIDNDTIFNFFKNESQLCDEYNLTNNLDRKNFCEDKQTFRKLTRFASIVVSPDKMKIGFTLESDTLTPDKVVGIFYPDRLNNKIHFLTNYYLGNEFISFSPNGMNFIYQGNCWEGMCGLYIKDSETVAEKANLNNPEFVDYRSADAEFIKWVSENELEYKIGEELKRETF